MSREAPFEAEIENDNSQFMDDLFNEALENIENARKKVDKMQRAGVSFSNPIVENKTRALAAKGKGGSEE